MNREDLQALRIPLLALAMTLLAAVGVVYFSGIMLDQAKATRTQRDAQLREARMRIQNAGEEKERIIRYVGGYQQLARAGFVGEEQRINWLDSLRIANREAQLFGVEYDIGAQKAYTYAHEFDPGKLVLQESLMHLKFRLLHEEDLLRFFRALAHQGGGFFTLDQCRMRRQSGKDEKGPQFQTNLTAECDVRWLTINPPVATPEKKP
jgi:hypothetical protein